MPTIEGITSACIIVHLELGQDYDDFVQQRHYRDVFDWLKPYAGVITVLLDAENFDLAALAVPVNEYRYKVDTLIDYEARAGIQPAWGIAEKSYRIYRYLSDNKFSHVFSVDSGGVLFYTGIAKSLGLGFQETQLITLAVSPLLGRLFCSENFPRYPQLLGRGYVERHALELCDLVLASQYMISWMKEAGYQPKRISSQFNIALPRLEQLSTETLASVSFNTVAIVLQHLPMHVIRAMLKGLSRYSNRLQNVDEVVFLFREGGEDPRIAKVRSLTEDSPFAIRFESFSKLHDLEAISAEGRTVFVFYSARFLHRDLVDYCLRKAMPFVFCDEKSRQEPVYVNEYLACPEHFVNTLCDVRLLGTDKPDESQGALVSGLFQLSTEPEASMPEVSEEEPFVSVCVVHHQRPDFLKRLLNSLSRQIYRNFEVIVVDDGSPSLQVQAEFDALAEQYTKHGWRFVKQSNRWLGAARNYAVSLAHGQYIIFMDDDNIATPQLVSGYVEAIVAGKKDILTCFAGLFEESGFQEYPNNIPEVKKTILPLGSAVAHGYFENIFGDAACIVRTEVFNQLGGFWQHYGLPKEDHDFFARAVDQGYRLEVVPQQLFYYRKAADGMMESSRKDPSYNFSVNSIFSDIKVESPFISKLELRGLLLFAVSSWYQRPGPIAQIVSSGPGEIRKIFNRPRKIFSVAKKVLLRMIRLVK